jgi:hypothetical protein
MFEVDRAIVKALFQKDLYHSDLHDKVNEICQRKVAEAVFNDALIRLRSQDRNIILRDVETEGRPRTKYKLSEKARQEYTFNTLKLDSSKKIEQRHQKQTTTNGSLAEESKQEHMYHLLFFFGTSYNPVYKLDTEEALQEFLAGIDISSDDLRIVEDDVPRVTRTARTWPYTLYVPIDERLSVLPVTAITPPYVISITRYKTPVSGLTLWKERYRYIEFDNEEIIRPELKKIRTKLKELRVRNLAIELHRYIVNGIAVSDLLNQDRHMFQHLNLSKEEVKRAFYLLKEKGLIRPACVFQKEERYEIADDMLAKVVAACWELFYTLFEGLTLTWIYLRGRKDKEREWLYRFCGGKVAEDVFRVCYYYRSSLPRADKRKDFQRKVKDEVGRLKRKAIDDIEEIKIKHATTIEKYYFPLDSLISLIFPPWLQEEQDEGKKKRSIRNLG